MVKLLNNYHVFAERGDAWDAPAATARPRATNPDGNIRVNSTGHLATIRHEVRQRLQGQIAEEAADDNPDLDRYTKAGKALSFKDRLAKERNSLSRSQSLFEAPAVDASIALRRKIANTRLRNIRRTSVVKG